MNKVAWARRRQERTRRNLVLEMLERREVLASQLLAPLAELAVLRPGSPVAGGPASAGGGSFSQPTIEWFASADELKQYLLDAAVTQYKHLFGQPDWWNWPQAGPWLDDLVGGAANVETMDSPITGLGDVSGTNVQVPGVDEGDIVKTDGKFLYHLGDGQISVIDVQSPDALKVVSRIELDSFASDLYVDGNFLTVVSHSWGPVGILEAARLFAPGFPFHDDPSVLVQVFDVSDPALPRMVESTEIDGNLVSSRSVGDFVYLIVQQDGGLPAPEVKCQEMPDWTPEDVGAPSPLFDVQGLREAMLRPFGFWEPPREGACVYESKEEYLARMGPQVLTIAIPQFRGTDAQGNQTSGALFEAAGVYALDDNDGTNLVSVIALDVNDGKAGPVSTAAGYSDFVSHVHATQESIYLASPRWSEQGEATVLLKFALGKDGSLVEAVAVGAVHGRPLNQFSLDEHENMLRIATTQGWGDESTNQVYVLKQADATLSIIGQLDDLSVGEQIFAARFLGDTAYLSTFRRIDPLLVIDLSNSAAPRVAGKLEIPGFSNYLQSMDGGYLIGLGRDANADSGWALDPLVSVFDVRDATKPSELDRYSVELGDWVGSEAFFDHHAISYFPEERVLVVPFESNSGGISELGMAEWNWRPVSEFWVFQLRPEDGTEAIQLLGRIEQDGIARRSLRIGENLFTISTESVQVQSLTDPTVPIGTLQFERTDFPDPVEPVVPWEDPCLVRFRIQPVDADGVAVDDVELGQDFTLNVFVEDLRDDPSGAFSAFLDLTYDPALAQVIGPIEAGAAYPNGRSGGLSRPGVLDEVGGIASLLPVGGGEQLLASIPFVADGLGTILFSGDPANLLSAHEVGLFDWDGVIPSTALEIAGATLNVVEGFHNFQEPTDTTEDGVTTPLDALVVINCLNEYGGGPTSFFRKLRSAAADGAEGKRLARWDVNEDRYVSPLDALLVINRLNESTAEGEGSPPERLAATRNERVASSLGEVDARPLVRETSRARSQAVDAPRANRTREQRPSLSTDTRLRSSQSLESAIAAVAQTVPRHSQPARDDFFARLADRAENAGDLLGRLAP